MDAPTRSHGAHPQPPAPTPANQARAAHHIHVHHTKTAGWQVIYHGKTRETLRRRLAFHDAITAGAAYARVHDCVLEVDR
jgi:hypothetical protein